MDFRKAASIVLKDRRYSKKQKVLAESGLTQARNPKGQRLAPWHSSQGIVYHNNNMCNTGNNIEHINIKTGTGGRQLCNECRTLSNQ